jgi:hypothetical protein
MSSQNINSDFRLCRYLKVSSSLLRNSLTFPEGALYKSYMIRLAALVSSSPCNDKKYKFY